MKTILVVDDQPEIRELIAATLHRETFEIFFASTGDAAVEMALQLVPHLIVMDVAMPGGIDGIEATRQIKANPLTQSSAVLLLTAHSDPHDRSNGLAAGADDYFTKPFSPLELLEKIDSLLG